MKKLLTTLATIAFLIYPSICVPSYLIELKTGGEILVPYYWKEGDQIEFYFYGGVVGIHKNEIRSIKEIDKEEIGARQDILVAKEKDSSAVPVPLEAEGIPGKEAGAEKGEAEGIDVEYYKNSKKELMEKHRAAKTKLDQALRTRDRRAYGEAKKEQKELYDKLSGLSRELKEKNNGVLPDWW